MRSVSMPAASVYAYAVAFGWIAGYSVLNVCFYHVIPCHGYSQRGSYFIRHLSKILNGVALVRYILYICVMQWSDYRYKGILFILSDVCIVTFVSIPGYIVRCHSIDAKLSVIFVLQTVQHYPEMIVGYIARQGRQIGVFSITLYMYIIVNGNKIKHNRA